jgi:hypothetical protein
MARRSEEQWKDIKFKLTVFVVLATVVTTVVCVGPGLRPIFLERARKNLDKPWAAVHMYNIARLEEMTMRRDNAMEIYSEIYINFAGNEQELDGIERALAELGSEGDEEKYFLAPWLATQYDLPGEEAENPRPNHQIGPKPHKMVPKALMRLGEYLEDHKDYVKTRHLFRAIKYCFPGTQEANEAEAALLRDVQRSF